MLDLDNVLGVLRKGSVKSCLKLFIALWVWHAVILQTQKEAKAHHDVFMYCKCRCYVQTSGACTGLTSCYSKELRTAELLQIKKL